MQAISQSIHQLNLSMKSLSYYVPEGRKSNQEVIDDFLAYAGGDLSKQEQEDIMYGLNRKFRFLETYARSCIIEETGDSSISMSVKVAKEAIQRANLQVSQIDLLLFTGVVNPFREPTYSNMIANQLGLEGKEYYDINDTCNGFMKAIDVASMYIATKRAQNVLVVTCESPAEMLNEIKGNIHISTVQEADQFMTLFLGGTGAAAVVVSENDGHKVLQSYSESRSSKDWDLSIIALPAVKLPEEKGRQNHILVQSDGMRTASKIIEKMPTFVSDYLEKENVDTQSIDYVFSHQIGRNTTYAVLKKLGLDVEHRLPVNKFDQMGNLACANIPVSLGIAMEQNLLQQGNSILLLSSSCGLNIAAMRMLW